MQARRGLDAFHARRLEVWHQVSGQGGKVWHPPPGGAVQQQGGAAGGAEPLAACRRVSFRAFAR